MGEQPNNSSDGRVLAQVALERIAGRRSDSDRLSDATLQRVVDIAWRHQFNPVERRTPSDELREALRPEVTRRMGESG